MHLTAHGMNQHVKSCTHRLGGLLDIVVTRDNFLHQKPTTYDSGLSDHYLVKWSMNLVLPDITYRSVTKRNWKELNIDEFSQDLLNSPLCALDSATVTRTSADVTVMAEQYNETIQDILDIRVPHVSVKIRVRPSNTWFDDECRTLKTVVRKSERIYRISQIQSDRDFWIDKLNLLRKLYRSKRAAATRDLIDNNKNCPRQLWHVLNSTLGLSQNKLEYLHNADEFADFFENKVTKIRDATATAPPPSVQLNLSHELLTFVSITETDVCKLVATLPSKQSELDPLPTWLLKQSIHLLAPFLTNLINSSFCTSTVPMCMKQAVVTPILKKDNLDRSDISNYRPISNLSFISKLMERFVGRQVSHYLESSSLLPVYQSAYRANHSTETALLRLYSDLVAASDAGEISLLALLDLSAAFDTVDHDILLRRLSETFGLGGSVLGWLSSYLTDRSQSIRCASGTSLSVSKPRPVTCGVPQGSVLGPLLFLLYTSGLNEVIQTHGLNGYFYADDSQIRSSNVASNGAIMKTGIINCINNVEQWMASNRLKLNPSKTEFMWCSTTHQRHLVDNSPFILGGTSITPSNSVRLLGVLVDCDLSMTSQVNQISKSCFYHLRRMKSVRRCLSTESSKTVVNSIVLSRIDYCNGLLVGITQRQIDRLQMILNSAARLIYGGTRRSHVTPLLRDNLHWLRFRQRITYKLCLMVYKALNDRSPQYLSNLILPAASASSSRRLRSADNFTLRAATCKKKFGERGFSVAAPAAWNSLSENTRRSTSVEIFKSNLKTELFRKSYDCQ